MTATAPATTLLGRLQGTPLVVMLDVDGTLAPIAPRPEDAAVPPATREALAALAAQGDVRLALVSGRAGVDALRVVGIPRLWAAGNHGFELVAPDGRVRAHADAVPYRAAVAAAAAELRDALAGVPGAIVEDKALTLSVHYRLVAPEQVEQVRSAATATAATHGLRASGGKMIVELRPPVAIDKGTAVISLADELGARLAGASVLFAGDDVTDEDAFRALRREIPQAVTVLVGDRPDTHAEFQVPDPDALRSLLATLVERRSTR